MRGLLLNPELFTQIPKPCWPPSHQPQRVTGSAVPEPLRFQASTPSRRSPESTVSGNPSLRPPRWVPSSFLHLHMIDSFVSPLTSNFITFQFFQQNSSPILLLITKKPCVYLCMSLFVCVCVCKYFIYVCYELCNYACIYVYITCLWMLNINSSNSNWVFLISHIWYLSCEYIYMYKCYDQFGFLWCNFLLGFTDQVSFVNDSSSPILLLLFFFFYYFLSF